MSTTKNAFSKAEIKAAEKTLLVFQDTLIKLNDITQAIGNNEYLMRKGVSLSAKVNSFPTPSGKLNISLVIKASMPKKESH